MGNSIVYESNRDGNWNLYQFDIASGVETRLTESQGNDINASWSSDGAKLLFQSDRTDSWQIFELTFATSQIWQISNETGDDLDPQYTHDNAGIIFRSFRGGNNSVIYQMNEDGSYIEPVSDPAGYAKDHGISPQGDYIAYTSNLDGDNDIYVYEVASKLTRQVTDTTENDYAPTWYCGDTNLAFTSDMTTNADLFSTSALPIDASPIAVMGGANQLTTSEANEQYPMLSPAEENASRRETLPSPPNDS
jgi:Tol biopolymer transport system component